MKDYKNYVNGEWLGSEKKIAIFSPINQEELGTVPAMSQEEVDKAIGLLNGPDTGGTKLWWDAK